MLQPKFKVSDWIFCEFDLSQVKRTEENRITEITTGRICLSGRDLSDRCFELNVRNKNISDTVKYWSNKFHALNNNSINYPDLNRDLIRRWVDMCETKSDTELRSLYDSLSEFGNAVCSKVNDLRFNEVGGVRLFR